MSVVVGSTVPLARRLMRGGYRFSLATNAKRLRGDHAQTKKIEQDDDSKKSHHAPSVRIDAKSLDPRALGAVNRFRADGSDEAIRLKHEAIFQPP
jgi:hypothetical protein